MSKKELIEQLIKYHNWLLVNSCYLNHSRTDAIKEYLKENQPSTPNTSGIGEVELRCPECGNEKYF